MRKTKRKKHTKTITKIVLFSGILIGGGIGIVTIMNRNVPEKRLMEYMKYIEKGEYEQMYAMLDQKKSSMNSKEEFIERNSKIYEGIEMSDLSITDITVKRQENGNAAVSYTTNMQTAAGNVEFTNNAVFSHNWTGYHLIWQDQLIFPELSATDKVQVTLEEAKRGNILDRNGRLHHTRVNETDNHYGCRRRRLNYTGNCSSKCNSFQRCVCHSIQESFQLISGNHFQTVAHQ